MAVEREKVAPRGLEGVVATVSRGRLVSGFVRGGGQEQLATGVNPAFNRERFEEAHELIVRAWTEPGPFRWEASRAFRSSPPFGSVEPNDTTIRSE